MPTPAHETMFEAWTSLAAISQQTSSIKLGQMVGCAPYRNPGLLAKITSNLGVMSGGRLIWGVGAGWYEHEFQHKTEVLREHCTTVGRDYDEIQKTWSPEVFVREDEQEIIDGGTRSFYGEPYDSWSAGNLVSTPEQVAEKIQTYIDLGCTGFYPWCSDYPDTETIRLFAEQVIPEVRRANP